MYKVGIAPVLRHRILWLLECGVTHLNHCRLAVETLVVILINNSNTQNDAVVELAAIQALLAITYDPPEDFVSFLHQPDILMASLYTITNKFEEVESKTDSLLLIQQLLTTFRLSGQNIDDEIMMQTIVRPLEPIWNSSEDQYLMLRSSVRMIHVIHCNSKTLYIYK